MIGTSARGLVSARTVSSSTVHTAEFLAKAGGQGIDVDVLDRHVQGVVAVLTTAALGLADADPVGGAITGALEAGAVDEGLDQIDRMSILGQPIGREATGKAGKQVRGQMGDVNPGKDEEADVVGDPGKALGPGWFVPPDELVARVDPPGGGAKERAADVAALAVAGEVGHVLADRAAQAEIVVADEILGEGSVARLLCGERLNGKGKQFPQGLRDRFRLGPWQVRVHGPKHTLGRWTPAFRQAYECALLELDQEAGTREVFQSSCGGPPVPSLGQRQGDLIAAPIGMVGDELADEGHVCIADVAALDAARGVHAPLL